MLAGSRDSEAIELGGPAGQGVEDVLALDVGEVAAGGVEASRQLEPEQVTFVESQGATFLLGSLQASGAVIAYRLEADGTLTFDSIEPVGFGWVAERVRILAASEREGSVTLLRSTCPR